MTPEELLAPYPPHLRDVAESLRRVVRRVLPEATEGVREGWRLIGYDVPVGRGHRFCAWIWPEFEHVHLGFEHGVLLDDPDRVLHGAEQRLKRVRYLTFTHRDQIDGKRCALFLRGAARLVNLTRSQRLGLVLDREARELD